MKKIADLIVKCAKFNILLFIGLVVFSIFSISKVNVEYSITSYLPTETDTAQAIKIMDDEFVTYGTSTIMIRNITYQDADKLADELKEIEGVKDIPFENTEDYYKDSCALYTITYTGDDEDEIAVTAYNTVIEKLSGYDYLVSYTFVDNYADSLSRDIRRILIVVVAIITVVLLFTSKSFMEVPIFLVVFGVSALLNMGTNYWLGTISFISNSVCVILQLALAIDYAIILSHRFAEEKEKVADPKEAMSLALSKGIVEISSSSLTTISGLLALCCMSLTLGRDLGIVLAKSIVCSMLTVFIFMPSLMLMFSKWLKKTEHRNFVPRIDFLGKGIYKTRFVLPVLFIALVIPGAILSNKITYVYSQNSISTAKPSSDQQAEAEVTSVFGSKNQFVILVPKGGYEAEETVVDELEKEPLISDVTSISGVEITNNGITLSLVEDINYIDLSDFIGIDEDISKQIFASYAFLSKDKTQDGLTELATFNVNPDIYRASLLDMMDTAFKHDDFIMAYLDGEDTQEDYEDIRDQIKDAEDQLIGTNYTRVVFNILADVEAEETFDLIERLNTNLKSKVSGLIFAGDSMSSYDLNSTFSKDNILISVLTVAFIYVILVFTFKNWALPLIMVGVIQGAIFINFMFPYLTGNNLFFFVYLIVSAIQMGATIDYAIVITNRYGELRDKVDKKQALISSLSDSFPTIVTSSVILMSAAFLIYFMVEDPLISTLGLALGRGTAISVASVMLALPAFLYLLYDPLKKCKIPSLNTKDFALVKRVTKRFKKEDDLK